MAQLTKANQEWMDEMNGHELWTDAFGARFGERVCVGITNGLCVHNGERFPPSNKEVKDLRRDMLVSEYGTSDMKEILRMEGM